jgi:hypothetical protein
MDMQPMAEENFLIRDIGRPFVLSDQLITYDFTREVILSAGSFRLLALVPSALIRVSK